MYTANTEQCTFASSELPRYAAFHQDLHCFRAISSGSALFAKINTIFTGLRYKNIWNYLIPMMDNTILIVFICMGKSTRIQRVNKPFLRHASFRMKKTETEKVFYRHSQHHAYANISDRPNGGCFISATIIVMDIMQ